jgi:hypothetical protein
MGMKGLEPKTISFAFVDTPQLIQAVTSLSRLESALMSLFVELCR